MGDEDMQNYQTKLNKFFDGLQTQCRNLCRLYTEKLEMFFRDFLSKCGKEKDSGSEKQLRAKRVL
jgi:hypothetical protein